MIKKIYDMKFERFKSKREKDMGKQIGENRRKEKIEDKEKEEWSGKVYEQ